jgi:hypothetical protein
LPRDHFPVHDAGVLAFLVGDDHPEPAVLFDDVDALHIDLGEPGPLLLPSGESGQGHHRAGHSEQGGRASRTSHLLLECADAVEEVGIG